MATVIQMRRGTAAEWTSVNPLLAQGEIGTELDTHKWKCGDGVLRWSALPYVTGGPGPKGDPGPAGAQGPAGATGAQGPAGVKGDPGAVGPSGPAGAAGSAGPQGDVGPQGVAGPAGAQGPKGDKGDTGAAGPTGAAGLGVPAGGGTGQVLAKKSPADNDTQWVAQTGGSGGSADIYAQTQDVGAPNVAIPSQAWTLFPIPATVVITRSDGTNADFTRNADGSLTILKAGNHSVVFGISTRVAALPDNTNLNIQLCRANGVTPTNGQNAFAAANATYGTNTNNFPVLSAVADIYCAAGDRIAAYFWQSGAATSFYMANFACTRQGAGATGPQGPQGAPGNLDMYAQSTLRPTMPMASATWTLITLVNVGFTITKSDGTNPDFVVNADGSLTIVKAGNYSLVASVSNPTAPPDNTAQLFLIMRKNGATPSPIAGDQTVAQSVSATASNANNNATELCVTELVCAANDRIALWGYQSPATGQGWQIFDVKVSRIGAGPVGPPGSPVAVTSARAFRSATGPAVPVGTWTKVALDAKTHDVSGNLYDAVNGRFLIPVAGTYSVKGTIVATTSPTGAYTYFLTAVWKNGNIVADPQSYPAVQSYISAHVSDEIVCAAGDYLELYAYCNGQPVNVLAGTTQTYMSVSLVTAGAGPPGPQGPQGLPGGVGDTAARAYRTAALAVPSGVWSKIPVDTVASDPGGHIVNGSYVCPSAGMYHVDANVALNTGAAAGAGAACYRNGVQMFKSILGQAASPANTAGAMASGVVSCQAGDILEVWVYTSASGLSLLQDAGMNYLSVSKTDQSGPQGPAGAPGKDGGGVPAGGYAYQVLTKQSATDLDVGWAYPSAPPPPAWNPVVPASPYNAAINDFVFASQAATFSVNLPTAASMLNTGGMVAVKSVKGAALVQTTDGKLIYQNFDTGSNVSTSVTCRAGATLVFTFDQGRNRWYVVSEQMVPILPGGAGMNGWKALTLTNAWVAVAGSTPGWYQDTMGGVHFRGHIGNGPSGTAAFTMSGGQRPGTAVADYWPLVVGGQATQAAAVISNTGAVVISTSNSQSPADVSLASLYYLAEA